MTIVRQPQDRKTTGPHKTIKKRDQALKKTIGTRLTIMETENPRPVPMKQGTLDHLLGEFKKGKIWCEPNAGLDMGPHDIGNSVRTIEAICARRNKSQPRAFLDLGCGCGRITAALSYRFPNDKIDIMDRNPHYLQHAQKQPGIKFRKAYEGDALNLRNVVGKTKYDVILMQGVG